MKIDEKNSILKRGPKQSLFDSTKYELEPDQPGDLGRQFEQFRKRDRFSQPARRPATTSVANDFYSKLVEKEMHLYKIYPKERPRYLQLLYKALKTIKPTSERAFSAMGFFVTKLRNRMRDKTLNGLIKMQGWSGSMAWGAQAPPPNIWGK